MRFSPGTAAIILALFLLAFLPGCDPAAGMASMPTGESTGPLVITDYTSEHYQVKLVSSETGPQAEEIVRHAAMLMEKMFDIYANLDGMPLPPGEIMPFWLHTNRKEYDRQAAMYEFPAHATNGFCTTAGEVHVYFLKNGKIPPEGTAMHEGFHQYCHRALHYPTPMEVFQKVPGYKLAKIPTVPLWLAEGMATNMESGRITREAHGIGIAIDDAGSVNVERLGQLARIINTNRCPSIRSVMNKIMGDTISVDDYAVMWGLVFDLRVVTGNAIFAREQRSLERTGGTAARDAINAAIDPSRPYPYMRWPVPVIGRLLRACRVVWGLNVPELVDTCATGAREARDFDRQWNRRVTQAALAEVEKLFKDNGETLEQWEQGWKKRMLALHTEVNGGTYVYFEPSGIKRAGNTWSIVEAPAPDVKFKTRMKSKSKSIADW